MKTRFWKEFRMMLPAWLLALVIIPAPLAWEKGLEANTLSMILIGIGCAVIAASLFGPEFSYRTMPLLLTQPISRTRIWGEKMIFLGLALLPLLVLLVWLSREFRVRPFAIYVIVFALFCAAPFLSMITRSTIAAAVFSIVLPILIWLAASSYQSWLEARAGEREWAGAMIEAKVLRAMMSAFAVYCIGMLSLGFWRFQRLEVSEGPFVQSQAGSSLDASIGALLSRMFPDQKSPIGNLMKKELRLQQVAFVVVLLFSAVEVLALAFVRWGEPKNPELYFLFPLAIYTALIPILLGAHSVAAERNLGVHAWQLALPVPAWKQWVVKLRVVLPLSFILGVCIPWGWVWIGHWLNEKVVSAPSLGFWPCVLAIFGQLLVTCFVMFASSRSNHTLRAAIVGAALSVGTYVLLGLGSRIVRFELKGPPRVDAHFSDVFVSVIFVIMCLTLLSYAFVNFRRYEPEPRDVWKQLAIVYLPLWPFALAALLILTLNRAL